MQSENQQPEETTSSATGQQPTTQPDREAQPVDAEQPPRLPFAVVGVGASAGGIEAFRAFLIAMPPDSGMAFVFILHLAPDRHSMVAEILGHHTQMTVREVDDNMLVEPNHVYVIRPACVLTIENGRLRLGARLDGPNTANRPVDDFFKSLAQEQRERAIAVIMSGMGSNGSAGAQAIKAVGGLCIAQEPETAQFSSMPRHLIDAGYADFISTPAEMPDVLLQYTSHPYASGGREADSATVLQREQQHMREVLAVLRTRVKQDFSGYKKPTVLRRIQRRMGLARIANIAEYARLLRQSPNEVHALADDLLIHVTGFFRDADAWEALRERVIIPLVAARENDSAIRCWVTACSSGEEAYSLAMLLVEETDRAGKHLDIKVFATDMAERTLANARNGVYPGGIEADIPVERLNRFFEKDDAAYRVRAELRECVVFAPQNILHDPPFSRLDIATCRNLLIYLEPEVQQRVLALLHFGLREGGALFLGSSETVGGSEDLFDPLDKKARIFRRVGPTRHGMIDFPLPQSIRSLQNRPGSVEGAATGSRPTVRPSLAQLTQRTLLENHLPAAVLIDRDYRILYYQGNTRQFIEQPSGEPTRDLLALARPGVRGAVRVAVHRATADNAAAAASEGWVEAESGQRSRLVVTASPVNDRSAGEFYVVSFDVRNEIDIVPDHGAGNGGPGVADEMRRMRDELQSTVEELQTSNEELKASHEEVMSINEELQSSNEELETSKEEMQSLNEELATVNAQLRAKMEEHQASSNDLSSLLRSTDIAVLFLDTRFRIRRFTPAVRDLLDLIASDIGRPLNDLAKKFHDPDLGADGEAVLERLVPIEREVVTHDGKWFLRRMTPYRTADNRIDGIVLAFVDITPRKRAEAKLRESETRLAQQLADARALQQISTELVSEHDATALYTHMVEAMGLLLRSDAVMLQNIDPETGDLVMLASRGLHPDSEKFWQRINIQSGTSCALAVTRGSRVIINDIANADFHPSAAHLAEYRRSKIRSMQSTPLVSRSGKPLGMVSTYWFELHTPTDDDLARLDILARQAADLIERLLAEESLRAAASRDAYRIKLADALRPFSEPALITSTALSVLAGELGVSNAFVIDATDDVAISAAFPEGATGLPDVTRLPAWMMQAYHAGHSVIIRDAHRDPRFSGDEHRNEHAMMLSGWIGVPLRGADELLAILVAHAGKPRFWSSDDVWVVEETAHRMWAAVERARGDTALHEGEERFRLLVEGARDFAMLMLDPDGSIATWNTGAERLLGFSEAEAIGQHGAIIFTPEDRAAGAVEAELTQAASTGRATDERWHVRKDGSRFWGSGVMTALRKPDGSIRGFVKVLRDDSARKHLEIAERAALDAATLANQTKDEFLATLSHELRTPLSAILLRSTTLSAESAPSVITDGLAAIRNSAEAQRKLIEDLLDTSRITSGNLRLEIQPVELSSVIDGAVESVLPAAIAKGVELVLPGDSAGIGIVQVDPNRMKQVMWNLLLNAVKFTPPRGTVTVALQRHDNVAEIRVTDTGRGMPADFIPHAFEPFTQADSTTTRRHGGLGLGLAICKKLVEQHGGTIAAESDGLDRGSTFMVTLPLQPAQEEASSKRDLSSASADNTSLDGLRVLLVEDHHETRQAVEAVLTAAGLIVDAVDSVPAALESYYKTRPDVLVSDLGMPDEDGYSLIRRVRAIEREVGTRPVPALALTAFVSKEHRRKALADGFNRHLGKPVDPGDLLKAVGLVVRGR